MKSARRDGEAHLRAMERHREIGVDGPLRDLACGGIDPGREIDRHDRRACRIDALDNGDCLGLGAPPNPVPNSASITTS